MLGPAGLGLIPFAPAPRVVQAHVSAAQPWPLLAPRALSTVMFGPGVSADPP